MATHQWDEVTRLFMADQVQLQTQIRIFLGKFSSKVPPSALKLLKLPRRTLKLLILLLFPAPGGLGGRLRNWLIILSVTHNIFNDCQIINCMSPGLVKAEIEKKGAVVVETGEEFPCNMCDKTYRSKNILRNHIQSFHGIAKKCKMCGKKTFQTRST